VLSPALFATTTYYFRVASLNLAGASNFINAGSTSTMAAGALAAVRGVLGRARDLGRGPVGGPAAQPAGAELEGYVLEASTAADFSAGDRFLEDRGCPRLHPDAPQPGAVSQHDLLLPRGRSELERAAWARTRPWLHIHAGAAPEAMAGRSSPSTLRP